MADNTGNTLASTGRSSFLTNAEKASPLGYYFAFIIIALVSGIYVLIEFGGLTPDKDALLVTSTDSLLVVGAVIFLGTSLFGYVKSKNLRIRNAMFGFSVASLSFCAASLTWAWYNIVVGVKVPYPSMVDVFFLVGSLATIASIYSAMKAIGESTGLRVKLSAIVIVLAAIATVAVVVTYAEFTDILAGGMTPVALMSIAYPALDILCLALAGNLVFTSLGRSVFESQMIIALGAAILSVSHIYFSVTTSLGFYVYGPLAVTLYAIAYMMYAIGISRYVDLAKFDLIMDRISKLARAQTGVP